MRGSPEVSTCLRSLLDAPSTLVGGMRTLAEEGQIKTDDFDVHHRAVGMLVSGLRLADYDAASGRGATNL